MVDVPAARSIIERIQPQEEQYAGWTKSTGVSFGGVNEKRGLRGPVSCSSQRGQRAGFGAKGAEGDPEPQMFNPTFGAGIADAGKTASHEEQETVRTVGLAFEQ